jgi:hypothetical protein
VNELTKGKSAVARLGNCPLTSHRTHGGGRQHCKSMSRPVPKRNRS